MNKQPQFVQSILGSWLGIFIGFSLSYVLTFHHPNITTIGLIFALQPLFTYSCYKLVMKNDDNAFLFCFITSVVSTFFGSVTSGI